MMKKFLRARDDDKGSRDAEAKFLNLAAKEKHYVYNGHIYDLD